jgi:tetratricopeptide (TPR) repeat protein
LGSGVVAIHRDDSDPVLLSQAVHAEAVLAYMLGTWDRCEELTREAASIAERAGSEPALAAATSILAMLAAGRGQLAEARQVFGRVASGLHRIDPTAPPFFTPVMLGFVVEVDDNGPRVFFEETVLLGRRVGAEQAAAYVLANLAYIARLAGELDEAQQLLEQAARSFTAVGDLDGEALVHNHLGCLARTRGEYDVGRAAFERALHLRHAIGDRRATGLTLANLGVLTAAEGDIEGGRLLLRQALADFREIEDAPGIVGMTLNLAGVHAAAGAFDEVVQILPDALEASVNVAGNHRATAWAFAMLADAYDRVGDTPAAEQARREAGARFAALGAVDGTDHVRHYLYSLQTPR